MHAVPNFRLTDRPVSGMSLFWSRGYLVCGVTSVDRWLGRRGAAAYSGGRHLAKQNRGARLTRTSAGCVSVRLGA